MKLICTLENLKKAIFDCERVIAKQNTLPILNNILIEAKKGELLFSATNLEIGVVTRIGVKTEEVGKITVPVKLLANFINNLPRDNENIEIKTKNQELKIKSKNSRSNVKGLSAEEFPLIPQKNSDWLFRIDSETFKELSSRIISCVAVNEMRVELTGINLTFSNKVLFFAATDSFRLAEYILKIKEGMINEEIYQKLIEKKENIIIPSSTLIEINRILQNKGDVDVEVSVDEGQIFFEIGETSVVSRLIEGKYPEYKHIMPKDYGVRVVVKKDEFQRLVKISGLFGNSRSLEVILKIDSKGSKIFIEGESVDMGKNVSEMIVDVSGESLDIVLNPKYLIDGLNNISTSQVAILLNNDNSPIALKEIDEKSGEVLDGFVYILMPIKNN